MTKEKRMPIPGFKGYKIHIVTREITNKFGTEVSQRYDNRGRLVVSLTKDNGKRTVAKVLDLLEKVFDLLELGKEKSSTESRILMSYYSNLDIGIAKLPLMCQAKMIFNDVSDVEILDIGRVLSKLKGMPT